MQSHAIRFVVAVLVAALGLIGAAPAASQAPVAAPPDTRPGEVAPGDPLFAATSRIRELPVRRGVKSVYSSRDDIERFAVRKFDEQTSDDEVRAAELTLRVLGLVPRDFAYRPFFASLMKEQVAGAYDSAAQQLQLPDWVPIGAQAAVLVHELTHALQDQHFDLGRLERWQKGDSDAQLAAHALAEGDAMVTMLIYLTQHPEAAVTLLQSAGAMADSPVLNNAPAALRETLEFPYEHGMRFVAALRAGGSWPAVSGAYERLPLSSEHIMHPFKYSAYERPVSVEVPDLASRLGTGWRRLQADVHGEWGYFQILKGFLPPGEQAGKAAEGWGGDRYALYVGPRPDDVLLVQVSAWDTVADAAEFFDAYGERTRTRHSLPATGGGEVSRGPDSGRRLVSTGSGSTFIEFRGTRAIALEGSPGLDLGAIGAALW